MGWWDNVKKSYREGQAKAEEQRRQREEEQQRKEGDRRRKIEETTKQLQDGVNQIFAGDKEEHEELDRLTSNHEALGELSDDELEHLRITTESDVAALEEDLKTAPSDYESTFGKQTGLVGGILNIGLKADQTNRREMIRKKKLLLKLIETKQKKKKTVEHKQPSREDKREEIKAELARLEAEKEQMVSAASSDEMKMKIANMYDDKQTQLLEELRKLL